jgi:hypothetical protein
MDEWDQEQLEKVVNEKHGKQKVHPTTNIVRKLPPLPTPLDTSSPMSFSSPDYHHLLVYTPCLLALRRGSTHHKGVRVAHNL